MQETANKWIIDPDDLKFAKNRGLAFWSLTGLLLSYLVILIDPYQAAELIRSLLVENGVYENLTAICFAGAAVMFGLAWWRERNIFLLLLTFIFFVGAGEEISWGQHALDYQTPDYLLEHNDQQEFNLHNLEWISGREDSEGWLPSVGQMFNLFWLFYCVLVPIAVYMSTRFYHIVEKIRLPIVNPWIGAFFLVNYLVARLVIQTIFPIERLRVVEYYTEVTEFVFSFLFAIVAFEFLLRSTQSARNRQDSLPDA